MYEWIESSVLPSSFTGGIPLHADDTNYTVRQKYNSRLDQLVDVFYFWVSNTTSIPENSVVRR